MLTQCRSLFTSFRRNKIASNMKYELMSHRRDGSMDMESFLCISGDQISKELFQREADSG